MNFNEEDIRSDVGFVCIGQAAGNIGLLFEEKGYNVLYINTSSEDLALLKNAKHVYHVPNGEGCAKDRDKAKYHLANDIDHLLDLIETKVPQKNVFVVFASGGGTGSGISPYLLNILVEKFSTDEDGELSANPAKLFSAITILPSDSEPLQPAINSYSCCKEILDIENLGTVFFIDNNSMEDKMKINKVFVNELDTVLSIPALHKSVKGNVDKAEIKKVIFETHGMGKILCRPRERGTAECIIHDLKDKSIYAPASLNGTVLYYVMSTTQDIDKKSIFVEFGEPLDTFQTKRKEDRYKALTSLDMDTYNALMILELVDDEELDEFLSEYNGILVPLLVTGRTLPVYGNERVYEWFANRVVTHSDGFLNVIASALQQLKKKKLLCNSKWFKTLLDMRFSAQEIVWLNYKMFGKSSYGDSAKLLLVRFMQTCLEPEVDLGDDMRKLIVEALLDEHGLKKVELFKNCRSVDNEANWLFIKSLVERNLLCSDCPFYLVHPLISLDLDKFNLMSEQDKFNCLDKDVLAIKTQEELMV